jgi:hypothetical protein
LRVTEYLLLYRDLLTILLAARSAAKETGERIEGTALD